ncbi:MAG TPA: SPFH domain-containing protein [Candidatus Thalassarchaeaceae archaeon]|nr:SPFH domain-containing protein [Candidatus Thalassarchaeaceae archaeon]
MTRTLAVRTLAAILALIAIPLVTAQEAETEGGGAAAIVVLAIFAIVILLLAFVLFLASRYRRCPPDKILVIYGRTDGTSSSNPIHGGGKLVWPLIQDYDYLDLKPITINIDLKNALSQQNIRINVPSTFTIAISTEQSIMQNAAERLLGLPITAISDMASDIILGQLRLTVAILNIEQINKDRDSFMELIRTNVEQELRKVGLSLLNVNIVDITDESDYIESIGKKAAATAVEKARADVAEQEKFGAIGKAEADREKDIQVAANQENAAMGVKTAEQQRRVDVAEKEAVAVGGENIARADIARSNADLAEQEAEANKRAMVASNLAQAEIQKAKFIEEEERLKAEEIVREQITKQQIEIAAEAEAERQRRIAQGEADAILARYKAEAEGQQAVLDAKAAGYEKLIAAAGGSAGDASTLLMVEKIESMVNAQVEAIRNMKIDKVTVWDGGGNNGDGSATSNFVSSLVKSLPPIHDVAKMAGVDLPAYLGTVSDPSEDSE